MTIKITDLSGNSYIPENTVEKKTEKVISTGKNEFKQMISEEKNINTVCGNGLVNKYLNAAVIGTAIMQGAGWIIYLIAEKIF